MIPLTFYFCIGWFSVMLLTYHLCIGSTSILVRQMPSWTNVSGTEVSSTYDDGTKSSIIVYFMNLCGSKQGKKRWWKITCLIKSNKKSGEQCDQKLKILSFWKKVAKTVAKAEIFQKYVHQSTICEFETSKSNNFWKL